MGRVPVFNLLSCVNVRGRNKRSPSSVCVCARARACAYMCLCARACVRARVCMVFSVLGLLISVYEICYGYFAL